MACFVYGLVINGGFMWEQTKAKDMELKGHTDSVDQLCWDGLWSC